MADAEFLEEKVRPSLDERFKEMFKTVNEERVATSFDDLIRKKLKIPNFADLKYRKAMEQQSRLPVISRWSEAAQTKASVNRNRAGSFYVSMLEGKARAKEAVAASPTGFRWTTSTGHAGSHAAARRLNIAARLENERHLRYAAKEVPQFGPVYNKKKAGAGKATWATGTTAKKAAFVTDFNYNKLNASYWARKNFPRTMFVADVADIGYKGANVASKALFGVSAGKMAAGLGIAAVGAGLLYEHFTGGNAIQDAGTGIGQAQGFFDNMEQSYRRSRFSRTRFQESTQGLVFGLHNAR